MDMSVSFAVRMLWWKAGLECPLRDSSGNRAHSPSGLFPNSSDDRSGKTLVSKGGRKAYPEGSTLNHKGTDAMAHALVHLRTVASVLPARRLRCATRRAVPRAVVFDMDGTLTRAEIDFARMRARTAIPTGDLFATMESWPEQKTVREAMEVILEMEASARSQTKIQPHLEELLEFLEASDVRLALVTRNTRKGTDSFFRLIHPKWKQKFQVVLTREFRFVKPDARLLHHVARRLKVHEHDMLMVGDSREDVECGNAAGTMTCLLEGGGNEVVPSPGTTSLSREEGEGEICASFGFCDEDVEAYEAALEEEGGEADPMLRAKDLAHLKEQLQHGALKGAVAHPPDGIAFVARLRASGHLRAAASSYPCIAKAAGGFCGDGGDYADRVLHLGCARGALTMAISCQGMRTLGVDVRPQAVEATRARGLQAMLLPSWEDGSAMESIKAKLGSHANVVVAHGNAAASFPWDSSPALDELGRTLSSNGRICARFGSKGRDIGSIQNALRESRFHLKSWSVESDSGVVEFIAEKA